MLQVVNSVMSIFGALNSLAVRDSMPAPNHLRWIETQAASA